MLAIAPLTVPGGGEVGIDGWVWGATAAGALITGLLFGLAPASSVWRTDLQSTLREGRDQTGGAGRRMRSVLVVAEIALALVLVTGAGLMVQSVRSMLDVDVGVDTSNALVAQFSLPSAEYGQPEEQILFTTSSSNARRLPGVEDAALSTLVPPAGGGQYHVRLEGVHDEWTMDLPVARARAVSTNYLESMGIPLVRGRGLSRPTMETLPWSSSSIRPSSTSTFPTRTPSGGRSGPCWTRLGRSWASWGT